MMKAQTARQIRTWHQYVGLFFTPAILFFSLSGALQTFGLHESHGDEPPAPAWIAWMASVHKDQQIIPRVRHLPESYSADPDPAQNGPKPRDGQDEHEGSGPSPIPLKIFVLFLAIGLITSSLLGVTIALTNVIIRRKALLALIFGTVVPLALALL